MDIAGNFSRRDDEIDLTFTVPLDAPPRVVFAHLTEPPLLAKWLAHAAVDLRVGGVIGLLWPGEEGVAAGMIDELDPPHVIGYTWREAEESHVRWTIEASGEGSVLTLVHRDVGDGAVGFGAGWHGHFEALTKVVRGETSTPEEGYVRYHELQPFYAEKLAPLIVHG